MDNRKNKKSYHIPSYSSDKNFLSYKLKLPEEDIQSSSNSSTHSLRSYQIKNTRYYGYCLLLIILLFFFFSMYALVISKILPDTGVFWLDNIKYDYYYCLLIPLTLPASVVFVFINWLGLKIFRHN